MFKVMVFLLVLAVVALALLVITRVPRHRQDRRAAEAEKKATWKVYRHPNGAGYWEIGVQRQWKDVILQQIPTTPVMSLPITASLEELLDAEGQATMLAGRMNEAPF